MFFWIAASAADIPADHPNGIKTLLANGVCTLFINGKPAVINGLRKLGNPSSWLAVFVVVSFYKIPQFSKELINFIISFISLFARVILNT